MTTGVEVKIFRAHTDALDTFATAQGLSVAKPGIAFTPSTGTPYLRAYIIPSTTDAFTVKGTTNEYRGIFQVNVTYPEGSGIIAAYEMASLLAAAFESGTTLSHGGLSLLVSIPPHIGPAIEEPGWVMIPVTIRYRAFVAP